MSAQEPKAGDWIVFRGHWAQVRRADRVTPKLIRFDGQGYPRQIERAKLIVALPNEEAANLFAQSVDGVEGEFRRRQTAADNDYRARVRAAREAADKQIAALVAKVASS